MNTFQRPQLHFPQYEFSIREMKGELEIFDPYRQKFVRLSPEEWVRQNLLRFLAEEKRFPASLIAVEYSLQYLQEMRRCDALVHDRNGKEWMLIECKAPTVKVTQKTIEQIARYNYQCKVPYLLVSNGNTSFMFKIDFNLPGIKLLKEIPDFENL